MVGQSVLIGIGVGLFLFGLVLGYVAFVGSTHSGNMMIDNQQTMMQDPETREKMIQIMNKHVDEMQELLSSELTDEEFNTQMTELMQSHMKEMQDLMSNHQMHQSMK